MSTLGQLSIFMTMLILLINAIAALLDIKAYKLFWSNIFQSVNLEKDSIYIERNPRVEKNPFSEQPYVSYAYVLDIKEGYIKYIHETHRGDPSNLDKNSFRDSHCTCSIADFKKKYHKKLNITRKDKLDAI